MCASALGGRDRVRNRTPAGRTAKYNPTGACLIQAEAAQLDRRRIGHHGSRCGLISPRPGRVSRDRDGVSRSARRGNERARVGDASTENVGRLAKERRTSCNALHGSVGCVEAKNTAAGSGHLLDEAFGPMKVFIFKPLPSTSGTIRNSPGGTVFGLYASARHA